MRQLHVMGTKLTQTDRNDNREERLKNFALGPHTYGDHSKAAANNDSHITHIKLNLRSSLADSMDQVYLAQAPPTH